MLIYAIGSWAITLFNLILWTLTLAKRQLSPLAKSYFWWSFYITLWSFGYGITLSGFLDYDTTLLWNRWCQAMAALIGPAFFRFSCVVANQEQRYQKLYRAYLAFAVVNAIGLIATPYYVKGLWSFGVFKYQPLGGPLYILFTTLFWWCTLHGFLVAAARYPKSTGEHRSQLKLFLLATGIAYFGGGGLFLQGFGLPIPSYGVFLILAYVIIIGYAVHQHRFLNVELALKKTVVFTGLLSLLCVVAALIIYVLQTSLYVQAGWSQTVGVAITLGIAVMLIHPIEDGLTYLTDRFLFQKKYDYKQLLRQFSEETLGILDLRKLVDMTVQTLINSLKLENCALMLINRVTNQYELTASEGMKLDKVTLEGNHPLSLLLRETQEPVIWEARRAEQLKFDAIDEFMQTYKAELCLPLVLHEELVGILILGRKKSDEPYTQEDLDLLTTLANTEAIAISNALLATEAAQKEKLAIIGTLASAINHEVCNPLNNIRVQTEGFLIQLKRGLFDKLSREELEQRISQLIGGGIHEIDRVAAITTRLSNFAKPNRQPVTEQVQVEQVIDEVMDLLGHDLELHEISISKVLGPNLPPLLIDRRQLQEILFNLVRNAGQAIQKGGEVTLAAHLNGSDQFVIEVRDTGSGIPPEQIPQLFVPFFTTKQEGEGTGLGLFVIKRLVERNEGKITVESQVGEGTTFRVHFPIHKQSDA